LTLVVPACNEEEAIASTLRSLMASEGICLQVIALDDRSTDSTGAIMDDIASQLGQENSRHSLQVVHVSKLPQGWLGKPHALATGARLSKENGVDWLLFTDGDVNFAPEALQLALRYALSEGTDHLVLMPDWTMKSHGEAAMHGALHVLSAWTLKLWRVADPEARDFLGVGAFNLVRRDVYESLGGFEALRMEVLEDLRFGWMLKRAGYRQQVVLGPGLAAVRWSVGAMGVVRNLEKNLFALYRYKTAVMVLACLGLTIQIVWPIAALILGGWVRLGGMAIYLAIAGLYIVSRKVTRVPAGYMVVYPLAAVVFLFAMLRSMTLTLIRGGVIWRGTFYSLRELRANAGRFWS
jgi:glycosyltransferase involved in cell wall biosynthesis